MFVDSFVFMTDPKILLVGLGNPGTAYHLTRHNIGFFFLDHLASVHGWHIESLKMQGLFGQGRAWRHQILCLKPQTYMNRSGECVRCFVDYFKIPCTHLLVLHDDLDLQPGRIKVVKSGGAGGHNGIRSLIQHLGTQNFARIKIGIGRPTESLGNQEQSVERFVLSRITDEELQLFDQRRKLIEEAVALFVQQGPDACMNRINGR